METDHHEIWARCNRWADYEASSLGRARRWRGGRVDGEPRMLKQHYHTCGYLMVQISEASRAVKSGDAHGNVGGHRQIGVHRLVADAFMGPCAPGYEVNHKDGVKDNNRVENLEYVTHKENVEHAIRLFGNWAKTGPKHWAFGRKTPEEVRKKMSESKRGVRHWRAKKVDPDVIKALDKSGMSQQAIAERLCVSRTCVGDVLRGTHWTVGGYRTNLERPFA